MPQSINPYDSLGRILEKQATERVGIQLYRGRELEKIEAYVQRRFGELPPADRSKLLDYAKAGLESADYLNRIEPDADIDVSRILINPFLFGETSGGNRLRVVALMSQPDGGSPIYVYVDLPDITNAADIQQTVRMIGMNIWRQYPGKFSIDTGISDADIPVSIVYAERRF